MAVVVFFLLLSISTAYAAVPVRRVSPLSRAWVPAESVDTPTSADCHVNYFKQPLDHFNLSETRTFQQRYFWNDTFFDSKAGGPILYYTGNEADVTLYVNATGLMWENAFTLKALIVFGEHRYYGETLPFGENPSAEELAWLSVEQSLEDHVALVNHIKNTVPGASQSKVVAIGGSYGGMQSSWARIRYPNVFDGAIAGSAPILAFDGLEKSVAKSAGPKSYWKIVSDDASAEFGSAPLCADNVKRAWSVIDDMFERGVASRKRLQNLLSMCDPVSSQSQLRALKDFLLMAFDTMAMGNFPFPSSYLASGQAILPAYPFRKACSYLSQNFSAHSNSDYDLIESLNRATSVFNNATKKLECYSLPSDPEFDGIWDYLWCTDTLCQETYFGRNGIDDMFWPFKYDEYSIDNHCKQKYDITPDYTHIASLFGGTDRVKNSSNIVFSNGRFDPWRSGGVTQINDTDKSLWSIILPNGAHHVDLMFSTEADPPDLKEARKFEVSRIKEWVGLKDATDLPPFPESVNPVYPQITETVHVINSCHLDIGFGDSAIGIINRYFDDHIARAISVADELRATSKYGGLDKLGFMFQSWVMSFYFDCPPNMGLHCPSADNISKVEMAIARGDITWHAFPHNAQLEIMGNSMIKAGVDLTHSLDDRFHVKRKATLSQRDVPGIPRSVIPVLNESGVRAISIGANEGSTPPQIPPCFLWKDESSGKSLLGLFTWPGYGSLPISNQKVCIIPGLKHALVYNWNGDNAGPFKAQEYESVWGQMMHIFPNAKNIVASTFDNFTQHLDKVRDKLPKLTSEIGDTWIYGVASDPQKVSRMKAIENAWDTMYIDPQKISIKGMKRDAHQKAVFLNATRFVLKLAEHTWGRDVKSNLKDNLSWKNNDFHRAKGAGSPTARQYEILEESWWEQRHWGITLAMETLKAGHHPLADSLALAFDQMQPTLPDVSSFLPLQAGMPVTCGSMTIAIDQTGAISKLIKEDIIVADEKNPLASIVYKTYSAADVSTFLKEYCPSKAAWIPKDYGKPGLPQSVESKIWKPTLSEAFFKKSVNELDEQCTIISHASFGSMALNDYGAVSDIWTEYKISGIESFIDVSIGLYNKTATRLPESMFIQWHPLLGDSKSDNGDWKAKTLNEWVSLSDIVQGGSKRLFGANSLQASSKEIDIEIMSRDASVASFGAFTAYPTPMNMSADTHDFGASFVLWDNLWGTNYVMWWPFTSPPPQQYAESCAYFPVAGNNNFLARFSMKLTNREKLSKV